MDRYWRNGYSFLVDWIYMINTTNGWVNNQDQRLDWTYDKKNFNKLPELIDDLHKHGQRYINIIVKTVYSKIMKNVIYFI